MMSSTRCRPRAFLIGCAWFVAASTMTTVFMCARDFADDGSTFYTNNNIAVYKRKPQSREYDYNSNGDDVSESDYLNDHSQQQQHVNDVTVTSLNIKSVVRDQQQLGSDAVNDVINNKIFWSQKAESLVPHGLTDEELSDFAKSISRTPVEKVEAAKWNRCGRPKNKYVVLKDGTVLCVRYRHPANTLLQGELLTFHLSRLLGIDSVPATILSITDDGALPWQGLNLSLVDWQANHIVSMTKWIPDLSHSRSRAHMPSLLLSAYNSGKPLSAVNNVTQEELSALVQWTDLIVFDYITGHYDRVASMQDGATHESNPNIMQQSVRNLRRQWSTGKLWLIDNESGLLDAYALLYGSNAGAAGSQFQEFHRRMLHTSCVFRRETVQRLEWLSLQSSPSHVLESAAAASSDLYQHFAESQELKLFRVYFNIRLNDVIQWMKRCRT